MISGVIYKIFPEEKHRDFLKKRFWVQQMNIKYPMMWELEVWHDDAVVQLHSFKVGDIVECDYAPVGRLYDMNGEQKVKTTLNCTRIDLNFRAPEQ